MRSKNISIIGFMGSGKSTVGRILAEKLDLLFIDLDNIIELSEESLINNIFDRHGEKYFRDIESGIVRKIYKNINCIFACGGGVVNRRENMELIIIFENVIPLELHEIDEIKNKNLRQMMDMRGKFVARFGIDPDDIFSVGTFGPILTDIIFAKSRRIPVIKRLAPFMIDDAMYERYADAIADLFLYGITGIANLKKETNKGNDSRRDC